MSKVKQTRFLVAESVVEGGIPDLAGPEVRAEIGQLSAHRLREALLGSDGRYGRID